MTDPIAEWYMTPLSLEDWIAGGSMLLLCAIFIPLTAFLAYIMYQSDKEIIGYRYLVSSSIADCLVMAQYGGILGVSILTKNPLAINEDGRSALQLYIDWVWFAFCLHYPLIAWSRFAAIKSPLLFCEQERWQSYIICLIPYVLAWIMACSTHWQSFYVVFYFEPAVYGMLAEDFPKYLTEGQASMFLYFHICCVVLPLMLYLWAIFILVRDRKINGIAGVSRGRMTVEKRLMIPCILGNIIFVLGQVAITIGTGTGKWASWLICFLFFINSAANCILLVAFSPNLRSSLIQGGRKVQAFERSTITKI